MDLDLLALKPRGACLGLDPGIFLPERGESTARAKAICAGCPIQAECLDFALEHDQRVGVWGGLAAKERRRLRRGELVPA